MKSARKATTRAEQKARRPHEIIEAAFEEFTTKGYSATRVEDIAKRLGVTKGTIYLYFPNKDALFEAMHRHVSETFTEVLASSDVFTGSCSQRLRALLLLVDKKIGKNRKTRELLRLSLAEGWRFPEIVDRHYDEFIAPLHTLVGEIIRQGEASGEFRQGAQTSIPDIVLSPLIHMMVSRLLHADRRPLDGTAFIEAHIDLLFNGLVRQD